MSLLRFFLPLALLSATLLGGCLQVLEDETPRERPVQPLRGELTIVTPHRREIQVEFEHAFRDRFPDIKIRWKAQRGTGDALRLVQQEYASAAARTKAAPYSDVFFGGGLEAFLDLEGKGLLQGLPSDYGVPPELNGVPLRSYNNQWVAAALSRFGILYNRALVERNRLPMPKSWADLGNPALKDQVELVDPRRSGSARVIYESILQLYGWERGWQILTAMTGNARTIVTSSSQPLEDVAAGQVAFAPSINFLAEAAVEESKRTSGGKELGYLDPPGQQVITPDPIGILKNARHPQLARAFVNFVMSPAGQNLWMLKQSSEGGPRESNLYRLSVLPSAYQPIHPNSLTRRDPYSEANIRLYDSRKAATRQKVLEDLIGAVLLENHALLQTRWKRAPNVRRLTFVPVSESRLVELAGQWGNSGFRKATIENWRNAAQQHFEKR